MSPPTVIATTFLSTLPLHLLHIKPVLLLQGEGIRYDKEGIR